MKKVLSWILVLAMMFALAACGGSGTTPSTPSNNDKPADAPADKPADTPAEAPTDEAVTLRFYTRYSDEDTMPRIDYALEHLPEYFPNVTVELEAAPADDGQSLLSMAATGDMPDIFGISGDNVIQTLATYGALKDLTPYLEANGFMDKVIATELSKVYFTDGNAYAIPFTGTEMANFFANTEVFAQYDQDIPETIEELIECAKVFSANGVATIPVFASENWITNAFFGALVTRYDPRGLDALYSGEASIHDEAYLKAATDLYNLQQAGAFPAGVTNMGYEQCTELWYNDKSALFFNGEWEADATWAAMGEKAVLIPYPAASEDTIESSKTAVVGGTGACAGLAVSALNDHYELAIDVTCRLAELMVEYDYIYRGKACFALNTTEGVAREVEPCPLVEEIGELRATLTSSTVLFSSANPDVSTAVAEGAQAIMAGIMTPEQFIESVAFAAEA